MRTRRLSLVLACIVASLGCGDDSAAPTVPSGPAGITGRVTAVVAAGSYTGTIKVEAIPGNPNAGDKAIVTVPTSATILSVQRQDVDFRALSPGQWVRVWFIGPVAESYPVQGRAATVVIDSAGIGVSN